MSKMYKPFRTAVAGCALLLLAGAPIALHAQDQSSTQSTTAPDNTAKNKAHATTADQQKDNTSDRKITQQIRQSIHDDNSLSTYGHNVKIITQNGAVTLRGPVHSEQERQDILSKAADVVGKDKVTDRLTVKQ